MNPNEDVFLSIRDVIRAGSTGELKILFELSTEVL
jgi:hypothetical protein